MFNFKKSIVAIMSALAISVAGISSTVSSVSAANLGSLNYWHSDSDTIGHMTTTAKIYVKNLSSNSNFNLSSYVGYGIYQWSVGTNVGFNLTGTESNHDIIVYGGTKDDIIALTGEYTEDNLKTGYLGLTIMGYADEGDYTYNGATKHGKKMTASTIAIVETDGSTNSQYQKVTAHELGHAAGYFGHSPNSNEIMSSGIGASTNASLTANEKNHLKQVY